MKRLVTDIYTFKGKVEDCENDYILAVQKKLKHYEDMEEQVRLICLPCKVGDTVYRIYLDGEYTVSWWDYKEEIFNLAYYERYINEFGKTVFLTKEKAEQALEKMKGE